MASNWEQITMQDGTVARKYPDGSIRNERGHPLPGTKINNSGYEITHENARALHSRRQELKRAIIAEAANEAVQRGDFKLKYGNQAYIAEIGYNAQLKAQNVDDPKQIDAARFLLQETGVAESIRGDNEVTPEQQAAAIGAASALRFIQDVITAQSARADVHLHDTIEGEVTIDTNDDVS